MIFKDYYKILEIEDYKIDFNGIKHAYREQAKKYHPDTNSTDKIAEERFKDINEAYKTLSDPIKRKKYDRMWYSNIGRKRYIKNKKKKSIINEFCEMFFGEKDIIEENTGKEKKKGNNIETEIDISINEAFYGKEKKLSLKSINEKNKIYIITIPAGIKNKEIIRLEGQGHLGVNGGKPGDLLIKVNIKNSNIYKLDGMDLYTNLYLTPWEAVLGTKVNLSTIDGEISLYIPEGTRSDEVIKIANKGYCDQNGNRGNLFARVCVTIPQNSSQQEKKIYQNLKKISKFNPREII